MLWGAIAFAVGLVLLWWLDVPSWLVFGGVGVVGWVAFKGARGSSWKNLAFLVLIGWVGMVRAEVDGRLPADRIGRWIGNRPHPLRVVGRWVSEPVWIGGGRLISGRLKVEAVWDGDGWRPALGQLEVRWPGLVKIPTYGDRVRLSGLVRSAESLSGLRTDPAGPSRRFDIGRWLWIHRIDGVLTVAAVEAVEPDSSLAIPIFTWHRRAMGSLRQNLMRLGQSLMGPVESACLEALVLGYQGNLPVWVRQAFRKTGTVHVLVVSGLHVGLIGSVAWILFACLRLPRAVSLWGVAAILVCYAVLTGLKPPIVRATLVGILICWALLKGLPIDALNLTGAAAWIILAIDPRALAHVGFQLSFSAVLGILLAMRFLADPLGLTTSGSGSGGRKLWKRLGQAWLVSLSAWAATTPILIWHFGQFSWIAPWANLVVVPWASLLIAVGLLTYAMGLIGPWAALPFATCFSFLARVWVGWVAWLAERAG